jgi:orotate phosphoribosyltransferase
MGLCSGPSSVARVEDLREELRNLILELAVKRGNFVLASGQQSSYYINCRLVTLHPRGAWVVGNLVYEMLVGSGVKAVGGPTLGADPIVTAVALTSSVRGSHVSAFIVRKQAKGHGEMQLIEGPVPTDPGTKVAIVEDVVTTGGSVLRAIDVVRERDLDVIRVIALVDRLQGAASAFAEKGVRFTPVFTIDDLGV